MSSMGTPAPSTAALDFPERRYLTLWEIAEKLRVSAQHIGDHVDQGSLIALDTSTSGSRRNLRIPIEEYRRFVALRLTGADRVMFLSVLPKASLQMFHADVAEALRRKAAQV